MSYEINKLLPENQIILLKGVTSSGKTEVYIQALQSVQDKGLGALVLLPEIALTPQTIARFKARIDGPLFLYHSKCTPKARLEVWSQVRKHKNAIVTQLK